jgi:outer membrane protein assembly factor BamB
MTALVQRIAIAALAAIGIGLTAADQTRQLSARPLAAVTGYDGKRYTIEDLGRPLTPKTTPVEFALKSTGGNATVWGAIWSSDRHGALGFEPATGKVHFIDTTADFGPHAHRTLVMPHGDDTVYVIAGKQFKIYKYTISTGECRLIHTFPAATGSYFMTAGATGPDGRIYLGTYPRSIVIGLDPATDRAFELPPMTDAPNQQYVNGPAVGDDNLLYAPVGRGRPEIFVWNPATQEKKQILTPAEIDAMIRENCYMPELFLFDGKVHTRIGDHHFRCTPDGLKPVAKLDWPRNHEIRFRANARYPDAKWNDRETAIEFNESGLVVAAGKATRVIPMAFEPIGHQLFRFGSLRNGVLYGSGIFTVALFGLNLETLTATDFGRVTSGRIQSYDMLSVPGGLLISSYTGASLDLFDPERPRAAGTNPRRIAWLEKDEHQERIPILTPVGERYVYGGTIPVKGMLGGAVVKVDLADFSVKVLQNLLPKQSINMLTRCPDGRTLFGCGSIYGGTGSAPEVKSAEIFLFDTAEDKIVWTGKAAADLALYTDSGLTADGHIFALGRTDGADGDKRYRAFVFDPVKREVTFAADLPAAFKFHPISHPEPMGPEKLNYFAFDGTLYAFDAAKREIRQLLSHPTLDVAADLFVAPDGWMYYLDRSRILRLKLF